MIYCKIYKCKHGCGAKFSDISIQSSQTHTHTHTHTHKNTKQEKVTCSHVTSLENHFNIKVL